MNKLSEIFVIFSTLCLVVLLTFIPHEIQIFLIDSVEYILNILLNVFISSSLFDTRLFVSNLGHLMVFCILGYVAGRFSRSFSVFSIFTVLILFALGSELSQFFVSGREPSISDLVINISAVSTGLLISVHRHQAQRRSSRSH